MSGESRGGYWLAVDAENMTHNGRPVYVMIACDDAADAVDRIFRGETGGAPFRIFVETTFAIKEA